MINGWRVHKYLSWLFLIVYLNECHNPLHIFIYFKPQQIVIGLHYDLEKMIYPLWKHCHKNQNGAELFNFSHLNLVQACRVWYCVLLSLPAIYLTAFWLNQIRFPVIVCRQSNSKWILFMNYVIMKKGRNQSLRSNKFKTETNNKFKK